MGVSASVQTTVNTINERIKHELQQTANASATANCEITIGDIIFHKNVGCNMSVKNMCSAQADAQLDAILKAVEQTYEELKPEQKAYVPGYLTAALNIQTSVNTVVKDFENYVKQTCNSDAVVNDKIKVKNFVIDECTSPPGTLMMFEFVNTGTSKGNCGIKAVMDVLTKSSTKVTPTQSSGTGFQYYIIAAVVVVLAMVFLYYAKRMLFTSTQDKIKLILAEKPDVHWTTYIDTFFTNSPTVV